MKPFSKEWWYHKGLEVCFSLYAPRKVSFKTFDRLDPIRDYCFKRYAEAYHREKMEEIEKNFWESDGVHRDAICLIRNSGLFAGIDQERERILGIIEELAYLSGDLLVRENRTYTTTKQLPFLLNKEELTQKIKGE